jgi:thiol-disulfide isomerase/thioredoxin
MAVISAYFACSTEPPPGEPIRFDVGKEFEPFELTDLEGQNRKSSEFQDRVTLVSFFFPTCSACNEELPFFQQFYDKYQDQGLNVVAINVIPEQDGMVPAWRDNNGFTFPILIGASTDILIKNYRLTSTPLNFLLDVQGKVIFRQEGYAPGSETRIESLIREALALE